MGVATKVRRAKGGGLSHVCWSHDGQRVFAASVGPVFRVWETQNWTCDKWTNFSGRCKVCVFVREKGSPSTFGSQRDYYLHKLQYVVHVPLLQVLLEFIHRQGLHQLVIS